MTFTEGLQSTEVTQTENISYVDVVNFGAIGDGVTDDTTAVQSAINYASENGISKVMFMKNHLITKSVVVPSNMELDLNGSTIVFDGSYAFVAQGRVVNEYNLGTNVSSGYITLTTESPNDFKVNDLLRIVSQRDALSSDAGDDWRLGYATPNAQGCYFAEFIRVAKINSTTSFNATAGLIFPNYRVDNTLETSPSARERTTIQKINPVKNVLIKNGTIKGKYSAGVRVVYGENCLIENVHFEHIGSATDAMASIMFRNSINCEAFNCTNYYDATEEASTENHYYRNGFKVISSQNCGFNKCYSENASQAFDITYEGGGVCSSYCYIIQCETNGTTSNGATTHGGTYASQIFDNRFLNCKRNGVSNRTRSTVIKGNLVVGNDRTVDSYGINVYEGWARDCVIEGNTIIGFGEAISVRDAADAEERFKWIGLVIKGNTIAQSVYAIRIRRSSFNKFTGDVGILIQSNVVKNARGASSSKVVYIENYVCGVVIKDNIFDGSNVSNAIVYGAPNAGNMTIEGNKMYNSLNKAIWVDEPTDLETFPNGVVINHKGNEFINIANSTAIKFGNNVNVRGYNVGRYTASNIAPNNTLFVDETDKVLKYKNASGKVILIG